MARSQLSLPARRSIRVFNLDPMQRDRLPTTAVLSVPWEPLSPGPVGSRIEVIDFDPVNRCFYERVDLDAPLLAAQNGLPPDERDPRMHQQMVYAVAARVLEVFDRSLGRRVRFRNQRLRLFPHAFYGVNALYQHELDAVLFGYFHASEPGDGIINGQPIFACLSHDIVAHEVTHALTFRLRPHFRQRTNPDVQAWSEAIADLVALLLHFQLEGVLESVIAASRVRLDDSSPLVEVAGQFGRSTRQRAALRTALANPDASALANETEPYKRATALVAAVFHGFFRTYEEETRRLIVLATNGTGVLAPGNVPPALVDAVSHETRRLSDRLLTICIRAIDYLPPVDLTFGDFIRALITADADLFPTGHSTLRQRLVEGFHRFGIHADGVWTLSESALRLEPAARPLMGMPVDAERVLLDCFDLRPRTATRTAPESPSASRWLSRGPGWARELTKWGKANAASLGLRADLPVRARHFHTSVRFDEDGQPRIDIVAQFLQSVEVSVSGRRLPLQLWGGATVVADASGAIRYVVSRAAPKPTGTRTARDAAMVEFVLNGERSGDSHSGLVGGDARALREALTHGF